MRLTFSILWFDDNEDYLDSLDQDYFKEEFSKWGFDCAIKFVTEPGDFTSESPYKSYDLIVVDYSLDPYDQHGQDFIKLVRNQHVLTDVVFYSSHPNSELWDAIRKEELEGIFIANRGNNQEKILKVAQQSIHKVLDLENVRGIVMAEVGSNDERLSEIAKKAFNELTADQQIILISNYVDKIEEHSKNTIHKLAALKGTMDVSSLLNLLDSSKKWNFCQSLSKKIADLNVGEQGDYKEEVLDKRNFLAHGLPEILEDGALKFCFHDKEYIFNDNESLKLRENLRKYREFFRLVVDNYDK